MEDRGAESIAAALPHHLALRELYMDGCRVSDAGTAALGAVLAQCPALEKVQIDRNHLSEPGKAALKIAWRHAGKQPGGLLV
mmetsp:Transcript_74077/g.171825  ORF Transcript_74077/g.171825 Transcript_74077/m.171825 type:complete len:82 (-) Transcript_74077:182-427(-)